MMLFCTAMSPLERESCQFLRKLESHNAVDEQAAIGRSHQTSINGSKPLSKLSGLKSPSRENLRTGYTAFDVGITPESKKRARSSMTAYM